MSFFHPMATDSNAISCRSATRKKHLSFTIHDTLLETLFFSLYQIVLGASALIPSFPSGIRAKREVRCGGSHIMKHNALQSCTESQYQTSSKVADSNVSVSLSVAHAFDLHKHIWSNCCYSAKIKHRTKILKGIAFLYVLVLFKAVFVFMIRVCLDVRKMENVFFSLFWSLKCKALYSCLLFWRICLNKSPPFTAVESHLLCK